jgi:ribonuclease M5
MDIEHIEFLKSEVTMKHDLPIIREVIVVEGKDDVAAVKQACQAQTIITRGLGLTREILQTIRQAQERCGVIVLTDPDGPGEKIRHRIQEAVPGCKHAYIYRDRKVKFGPVGVEYATPEAIRAALAEAKATVTAKSTEAYTMEDMLQLGLSGQPTAQMRRDQLGKILGIGQTNAKQFLKRLNSYDITAEELADGIKQLDLS